jgi:hypothetical protein
MEGSQGDRKHGVAAVIALSMRRNSWIGNSTLYRRFWDGSPKKIVIGVSSSGRQSQVRAPVTTNIEDYLTGQRALNVDG